MGAGLLAVKSGFILFIKELSVFFYTINTLEREKGLKWFLPQLTNSTLQQLETKFWKICRCILLSFMKWLIIHIHTPGVYCPNSLVPDPQISTSISRNCAVLCHPWVASTSLVPKNWSKHSKLRLSYPPTNLSNPATHPLESSQSPPSTPQIQETNLSNLNHPPYPDVIPPSIQSHSLYPAYIPHSMSTSSRSPPPTPQTLNPKP